LVPVIVVVVVVGSIFPGFGVPYKRFFVGYLLVPTVFPRSDHFLSTLSIVVEFVKRLFNNLVQVRIPHVFAIQSLTPVLI